MSQHECATYDLLTGTKGNKCPYFDSCSGTSCPLYNFGDAKIDTAADRLHNRVVKNLSQTQQNKNAKLN